MDNQSIIQQNFERKMAHFDKTAKSILVSWATNCAVATLSEKVKNDFIVVRDILENRVPYFISLYEKLMAEQNQPVEIKKVKEFLERIPNQTPAQYEKESEQEDNLSRQL